MTLDDLIAEGEALARRAWLLGPRPTESGVVGYWGGERADKPNTLPPAVTAYRACRHRFTLSESLLTDLIARPGPLSLFEYETTGGDPHTRVEYDYRLHFADMRFTGEPLYATAARSFPPFPAVCLYGSDLVRDWLAARGLTRHEYWQVADDLEAGYTAEWAARSAFHAGAADVIVGGWHFLWPEDDFFTPPELRLVALSLRDAEPWYEVWYSRPSYGVHARVRVS